MIENIVWIFDNLQRLQGVPVNENNVNILFLSLVKLKEVYQTLQKEGEDGDAETENRQAPDPG